MDNLLQIGGNLDSASAGRLGVYINAVFQAGAEHRMSDEVIKSALNLISSLTEAKNVNISGSVFAETYITQGARKEDDVPEYVQGADEAKAVREEEEEEEKDEEDNEKNN